ncbi:1,3-beta-glucan synthase component-domain-containing protein [Lactarius pseudohatsudake]|nr:1,3-beta-glucan synthase component-domain-containing protein [Lactarius pseudohatsudake]
MVFMYAVHQIAYLDKEPRKDGGEPHGPRKPKFCIEFPGNPILGDGKSDNQNHAIIFYRGEYLQLIDASQDNYLEECLKIRSVLAEFEEYSVSSQSPYAQWGQKEFKAAPVAIVGAREYIFSENIGILSDIAAGKEQTFGTLTARSLVWIGSKLHYGHPDFLNTTFMTTRGGVSKAQKGLHLNEDIYPGMNTFGRGGRIKHTEYYQCGKGRDLGFGTILNFQTKIGTGMGEQMLSREYYYLGTQLPIDRFLAFYCGHPGFHINNMLIILSVQLFIVAMVFLGTLNSQLTICRYSSTGQPLNGQGGCYNLHPVFNWIHHCIISIFLVFMIVSFLVYIFTKQFVSFSPVFEVFSTQIYTHSILNNLTFGGARYIPMGRGFATSHISFSILFSRFAGPSIYLGMCTLLMLLYATLSFWTPYLIYFWISILALCIAPFIRKTHFSFADFIVDYREFLRWMSRGNSRSHNIYWIGYCQSSHTMITGYKKKKLNRPSEKLSGDVPHAGWRTVIISEVLFPIFFAILLIIVYIQTPPSPLICITVVSLVQLCGTIFMATLAHVLGTIGMIRFFEFFWFLELWDMSHAVLGLITIVAIQRALHKVLISVFLSREFKHDEMNRAWWTGKWYVASLAREFIVKVIKLSLWSSDFLIGHFILFMLTPALLVPYVDWLHSIVLFWLSKQIHAPIFNVKIIKYVPIFFTVIAIFVGLIAACESLNRASYPRNVLMHGTLSQAVVLKDTICLHCTLCNQL